MLGYEYAMDIATVICDDHIADKVRELRLEALIAAHARALHFSKQGFEPMLTKAVYTKRAAFIMKATTQREIKEIFAPPKPYNSGGKLENLSPYAIDEEELMIWSVTSLKAPLSSEGVNRVAELFKKVYGCSVEELM